MRHFSRIVFGVLLLTACARKPMSPVVRAEQISVSGNVIQPKMEKAIKPYRESAEKRLTEQIIYSEKSMKKALPESELSNMMADAVLWSAQKWLSGEEGRPVAEFCLLNFGGIRSALPQGMLTLKNLYELMPFENEMVLVKLDESDLRALFDYVAQKGGAPVAGIRIVIEGGVWKSVQIGEVSFDFNKEVWVATSDFLAGGGDGMTFLTRPISMIETQVKIRDAIKDYLLDLKRRGLTLNPRLDGRVMVR